MTSSFPSPPSDYMDTTESDYILLPPELWSVAYLTVPGVLQNAIRANGLRVSEVFAAASAPALPTYVSPPLPPPPPVAPPAHRPAAPPISPFDGSSTNLRSFCSQLQNQFLDQPECFPNEGSKVRYAYRCLGPPALGKMRSSFRCYEDVSVPSEITTIEQFFTALRQRCQDPGLVERASRTVETLYQKNMKFHDFISIFEDNLADSTYANHDKSQWKTMLERRLSVELKNLLNAASDAPTDYHEFVSYLRKKDANIQVINAPLHAPSVQQTVPTPRPLHSSNFTPSPVPNSSARSELTVSQGGSAMDLDAISQQRLPNGRLTQPAKDARRALGRFVRCNRTGHTTENCAPRPRTLAAMDIQPAGQDQLKD